MTEKLLWEEEMMKKRCLAVMLAVSMLIGVFTGCSGKTDNSAEESVAGSEVNNSTETSDEKVTLKWALWDLEATAYWKPLAEAYMKNHPNVEIEYVDLGSTDYEVMLSTQLAGGADLDIITNKGTNDYLNNTSKGAFEPLNDFIAAEGINTADYNGIIEDITLDGEVYALPFRSDFWLIFYNKDLFDQAGVPYPDNDTTVQEYFDMGYQLTQGEGNDKVYGLFNPPWTQPILNFGVQDGKHEIYTDDYSMLKPYYEIFLKAQDDGICMDYATMTTAGTHYSGVFYNQQAAMVYIGSWFVTMQMEKVKSGESQAVNWGIAKFPHVEGVEPGTTVGNYTTLSVNVNSKHKEEALDFIKFASGAEGAQLLAEMGTFPALMNDDVINTIASADGFPQDETSREALHPTKVILDSMIHEKATEFGELIYEGHSNIMNGNCTIDEGIETMNEKARKLLE